jgi:hypothetical protein
MKKSSLKYSFGIYISLLACSVSAIPIVDFDGGSTEFGGGDFSAGFTFSITGSQTVNGLSWWDEAGDGLASDHEVGLWSLGGALLASTTITNASTSEASISGFGNWMIESIAGLTLGAGDYVVGGVQTNSIGGDLYRTNATAIAVSGVVFGDAVENTSSGLTLVMPDQLVSSVNDGAWGPNVHFSSVTVPEPTSLALLGIGLAGLCFTRKKKIS